MFNINDYVVYKTNGVCQITGIKTETFGNETKDYYILTTVYGNPSNVYVPVDNEALVSKMKRIISVEKIHDIIDKSADKNVDWIDNDRDRNEAYTAMVAEGEPSLLFSLVKTLYNHKKEVEDAGRKFRANDKRIMDSAEKILHQEFAMALDIDPEEVVPFIESELKKK